MKTRKAPFERLNKTLKSLDFFGINLGFQINEEEQYQSAFGGVISILLSIFCVIYVLINFIPFYNRESVNVAYNEEINDFAPQINLFNYSLSVAVGLDSDNIEITKTLEKYLDIKFNYIVHKKIKGVVTKIKVEMNMTKCDYSNFYNKMNDTFDLVKLDTYMCPHVSHYVMQGLYTEDKFGYFEYVVSLKSSIFTEDGIDSINEVKKILRENEIRANIYYTDTSILVLDYKNPIKYFLNNKFSTLDWRLLKKVNLDFFQLSFKSDENILTVDESNNKDLLILGDCYNYFNDIGEDRNQNRNVLGKFYLKSSNKKKVINRKYTKLSEFLADMSSIISSVFVILFVGLKYINDFKAIQYVMKKILKFKDNYCTDKSEEVIYLKEKFSDDSK